MYDLLGEIGNDDIAYNWILTLFPATTDNAYGAAFASFTAALTFLASLFVGFHILVGIVSSAYSGKVLGERYHQIWAPLRVVLGFGMMVPIAGGFSAVHYLLRDFVGPAAVNLGNLPIVQYIDYLAKNGGDIDVPSLQGRFVVQAVMEREICVGVQNAIRDNTFIFKGTKAEAPPIEGRPGSNSTTQVWDYGPCGSFSMVVPVNPDNETWTERASQAVGLLDDTLTDRLDQFAVRRNEATKELVEKVRGSINYVKLGEYFSTKSYNDIPSYDLARELEREGIIPAQAGIVMAQAAEVWNQRIAEAAAGVYADMSDGVKEKVKERIETYGFMAAGSYERELSKISGTTSTLANATPVLTQPNPGAAYEEAYAAAMQAVSSVRGLDNRALLNSGNATAGDGAGVIDAVLSSMFPSQMAMMKSERRYDPVGDMIQFGHTILTSVTAGFMVLAALSGGATAANTSLTALVGSGAVGGAVLFLVDLLTPLLGVIVIIGVVHAYVLPMLPMIMVFIMGLSWLVMFLEAAIASVLWAFAFVRMDGQEFFDRNQSPGVALIFNLFLRPALGMLAFIGSLLLLPEILNALNILWDQSYDAQVGFGGLLFLFKWITGLVMFTWMQWTLSLRMFGLIPTIADRVGHWMGIGSSAGYGDGQETSAVAGAMVGGVAVSGIQHGYGAASKAFANKQARKQQRQQPDKNEKVDAE